MAHILSAVSAPKTDIVPVTRALISVSDKSGIVDFCTNLSKHNVHLLSTGGTAKILRESGLQVTDVSDFTGSPECLDGRVKTLHPKIHGGILGVRGNPEHESQMKEQGMDRIDMVVVNLYPFNETVAKDGSTFEDCVENVDIGGPSMLRSCAKNHAGGTTIVTNPDQYSDVVDCLAKNGGSTTLGLRRRFAAKAFAVSAAYDTAIAEWFAGQVVPSDENGDDVGATRSMTVRQYKPQFELKYGCNPHQKPASISSIKLGCGKQMKLPFDVLNGVPGYINLLDAANAWQLVRELGIATGKASAASFKHVSPAGAAVASVPLSEVEANAYGYTMEKASNLTDAALAYVRARNADPMCSFGDFAAISVEVDEQTAMVLKSEVSDGIVAPSYTTAALDILQKKRGGKFIILKADPDYDPGSLEYREVYGMAFSQKRNDIVVSNDHFGKESVVTEPKDALNDGAVRDLVVASICVKYTQSNSVGFAKDGMMVGVGAGQQSRVDCVKLAGRKVRTWYLRQHPKVLNLPFKNGIKRQDKVNARVRYIEGDFTAEERIRWEAQFTSIPEPLTDTEREDFMATASNVAISSDAFFPFRDSIDFASKFGVSFVAQPGGSVQDGQVASACEEYGMQMCNTGVRLFHH